MRLKWDDGSHIFYKLAKVGECTGGEVDEASQGEANWGRLYVDGVVSNVIGIIALSLSGRGYIELERNIIEGFSPPCEVELTFSRNSKQQIELGIERWQGKAIEVNIEHGHQNMTESWGFVV